MRLGMPLADCPTIDQLCAACHTYGLRAVYVDAAHVDTAGGPERYAAALAAADLIPAEVGAWSNPLSRDAATRNKARTLCAEQLALADAVGARCCVNIAGSLGDKWDGPCNRDLDDDTVDLVVESVRSIIDAVKPKRTSYTLETMPWMLPDSADAYVALVKAIDRPAFAVHFDPVNLINSPRRFAANGALIRDFVAKLGSRIRSVHCKDIALRTHLTLHLDECRPGTGGLDHAALFTALAGLDPDLPVMLEHLPNQHEYLTAASHLRGIATTAGVTL